MVRGGSGREREWGERERERERGKERVNLWTEEAADSPHL